MRWNPFINAGAAAAYIALIAAFMRFIESVRHDTPDTIFDGMGFLSLFVFSAAVMAFLFFYRPVMLLIENRMKEGVAFFLKTLATFGVITILLLVLVSTQ
jgi:hypothetical protein